MENIRKESKNMGRCVPAKSQDVTLMAEHTELDLAMDKIARCLAQLKLCASGRDIEDEIRAFVTQLAKRGELCASRLERIAAMPGVNGKPADAQRTRLADMDFFLANPDSALTRQHNMALAAQAAGHARVVAAWALAGVEATCEVDRLHKAYELLKPQAEAVRKRVMDRRMELAREYPHLLPMTAFLELTGIEQSCAVWTIRSEGAA